MTPATNSTPRRVTVSVSLPSNVADAAQLAAIKQNVSLSMYVRLAVEKDLKRAPRAAGR